MSTCSRPVLCVQAASPNCTRSYNNLRWASQTLPGELVPRDTEKDSDKWRWLSNYEMMKSWALGKVIKQLEKKVCQEGQEHSMQKLELREDLL